MPEMKIEHVENIKIAKFEAPGNIFYAGSNFIKNKTICIKNIVGEQDLQQHIFFFIDIL